MLLGMKGQVGDDSKALPCDRTRCCMGGAGTGTKIPSGIGFKRENSSKAEKFPKDWIYVGLVRVT